MRKTGYSLSKSNIFIILLTFLLTAAWQMLGMALESMRLGGGLSTEMLVSDVGKGTVYGLTAALICAAVILLSRRSESVEENHTDFYGADRHKAARRSFWINMAIILLCWIPCFIAYYPAIYSYDGEPQLIQYTTGAFDNHHPVFHTLVMGWCYDLGKLITASVRSLPGSFGESESFYLDGMAIYAVLQMLLLAGAYAGVIAFACRVHIRKLYRVLIVLWFALFPVHPLMAITTTKDSMYTGGLVIFLTAMAEVLYAGSNVSSVQQSVSLPLENVQTFSQGLENTRAKKNCEYYSPCIRLFFGAVLMMLCRKNGLYTMCGTAGVLLIYSCVLAKRERIGKQKDNSLKQNAARKPEGSRNSGQLAVQVNIGNNVKRAALLCLAICLLAIVSAVLTENVLLKATGAVQGESAEALSIPLQQLARAYKSNTDDFTMEDLEEIAEYETIVGLNNYRPFISDVVKQNFNNENFRENPFGFVRIWLKYGRRYPGSYLMAVLYHTMGAWYPDDISHTIVYADWWRNRTGYLITDAIPVFAQRFVVKENLWPTVRDLYERIATECIHQKFVVTRILFSPFLYCIMTVIFSVAALINALTRKSSGEVGISPGEDESSEKNGGQMDNGRDPRRDLRRLILMTPLFIHYLMILAGPCVIIRYIYPLMAALPVVFIVSGDETN